MVWLPRLVPTNGMSVKLVRPACLSSLSVNVSDVSRLLHNKIFDAWLKKKNKVADPSNLSTKSCVFSFVLSTNVWIKLHSNGFNVMHTLHMHIHVHVHACTCTYRHTDSARSHSVFTVKLLIQTGVATVESLSCYSSS